MNRILLLLLGLFLPTLIFAQTPGLIVKPAGLGKAVLDPNGDGYISADNTGFSSNDVGESEILFTPLKVLEVDPIGDLGPGPDGKFSDLVDNGTQYPIAFFTDGTNLLFRFRLGGYANNAKGYSILVDADGKFGNIGPNADPDWTPSNPGFEFEVLYASNFGVRLIDLNGVSPTVLETLPEDDYAQKAIAFTSNSTDLDFFYDFYTPISKLSQYFGISSGTPLRFVGNTVIAPQSALDGPISDLGGVDDTNVGDPTEAWTNLINNQSGESTNGAERSNPPIITDSPIVGGTSISGNFDVNALELGATINIYIDGVLQAQTTVSGGASPGAWTVTGLTAFSAGQKITATATNNGETVSVFSNEVTVGPANCTGNFSAFSTAPTFCATNNTKSFSGGAPNGSLVRVLEVNSTLASEDLSQSSSYVLEVTVSGAGNPSPNFGAHCQAGLNLNNPNCPGSGGGCLSGSYVFTVTEPGKCPFSLVVNQPSCTSHTGTYTINPVTTGTGVSISGTSSIANDKVYLFIEDELVDVIDASGGTWTSIALNVSDGQMIKVMGTDNSGANCLAGTVMTNVTTPQSSAPIITGSYNDLSTIINGTSSEADGTIITLYKNGVSIGTTTVSGGNWTIGVSGLNGGDNLTATATADGESESPLSNTATVTSAPSTPGNITINGSYFEGDDPSQSTPVNGTATAGSAGFTVNLYIDGVLIGTGTVLGDLSWSIDVAETELYAEGVLTATLQSGGNAESTPSAGVTVQCSPPSGALSFNVLSDEVCEQTTATIVLLNSEEGVIYTVENAADNSVISPSVLGTGGDISFNTVGLTATITVQIRAQKIPDTSCDAVITSANPSATITVYPNPSDALTLSVVEALPIPEGTSATIRITAAENNVTYQLQNAATSQLVGSSAVGSGADLDLTTPSLNQATTFNIIATDETQPTQCRVTLSAQATVSVDSDRDGDGVADAVDIDDDNDGILDTVEGNGDDPSADLDGDGIPNYADLNDTTPPTWSLLDSNGDGIVDYFDTDLDGIPNHYDLDSDNDGLNDLKESGFSSAQIASLDTDNNGILDDTGVGANGLVNDAETAVDSGTPLYTTIQNTDGDGAPDFLDLDSDNDGINDVIEAYPNGTDLDANNDGLVDGIDADGDGILSGADGNDNALGDVADTNNPEDTDGDGVPDFRDLDSDNDGINDVVEGGNAGLDTNGDGVIDSNDTGGADSDGDGISDSLDGDTSGFGDANDRITSTDNDASPDFRDLDSDNDGINDVREGHPDGANLDSNNDGIVDNAGNDADGDGIVDDADGNDAGFGDGAGNSGSVDSDGDGVPDFQDLDSDNDSINDVVEGGNGSADTNGDGLVDGNDSDGDGILDDVDGDDAAYGEGLGGDTPPTEQGGADADLIPDYRDTDSNGDGTNDIDDAGNGALDGDNDGRVDENNDPDGDGIVGEADGNPVGFGDASDADGDGIANNADIDSDNDGIPNIEEGQGTDPYADADADGVPNFIDLSPGGGIASTDANGDGLLDFFDQDLDGIPNHLDLDSDNDGIPDVIEAGGADDNGDGIVDFAEADANAADADNDGLIDNIDNGTSSSMTDGTFYSPLGAIDTDSDGVPDFLDVDSDNDGIYDVTESGGTDSNNDGRIDFTGTFAANDSDGNGWIDSQDGGNGGSSPIVSTGSTPGSAPTSYTDNQAGFNVDQDGDNVLNFRDLDSDNDGINDVIEAGLAGYNSDSDGLVSTNALSSGQGISATSSPLDTDSDGIPDYLDLDADNDGINDVRENGGLDANNDGIVDGNDADGDGILSSADSDPGAWAETADTGPLNSDAGLGTDGDGVPNFRDLDSDNDGALDIWEYEGLLTASGSSLDGDGNGVLDDADADGDGIPDIADGDDAGFGEGGGDSAPANTDDPVDSIPDYLDLDSDDNGINDVDEACDIPAPNCSAFDSDGDGVVNGVDSDGDGILNPVDESENNFGSLPLDFLSFQVRLEKARVHIDWKTLNEVQVSHFEVERSTDAQNFESIGQVEAKNQEFNEYQFMDNQPTPGRSYYRITQFDEDAQFQSTFVLSIWFEERSPIQIYPNPSANKVHIRLESNLEEEIRIQVLDIQGRILEERVSHKKAGLKIERLDVQKLPAGTYFIQILRAGNKESFKLIKE